MYKNTISKYSGYWAGSLAPLQYSSVCLSTNLKANTWSWIWKQICEQWHKVGLDTDLSSHKDTFWSCRSCWKQFAQVLSDFVEDSGDAVTQDSSLCDQESIIHGVCLTLCSRTPCVSCYCAIQTQGTSLRSCHTKQRLTSSSWQGKVLFKYSLLYLPTGNLCC